MPRKSGWLSIDEASAVAQARGIITVAAWRQFAASARGRALPVPVNPQIVYKDQWLGWEVFFGAEVRVSKVMPRGMRSFAQAREFARAQGFKSPREWFDFASSLECPPDLPSLPHRSYAGGGWRGYPDFLGYSPETGSEKPFWPFAQARAYARRLRLSGSPAYRAWAASEVRPQEMPTHPERTYAGQWKSWEDFLGAAHGSVRPGPQRQTLPFELARFAAHSLGFTSPEQYRAWATGRARVAGMPVRPDTCYRLEGWKGWADFLGTTPTGRGKARTLLAFAAARRLVRQRGLGSGREYQNTLVKERPAELPVRPEMAYAEKGWKGWRDFLGTA